MTSVDVDDTADDVAGATIADRALVPGDLGTYTEEELRAVGVAEGLLPWADARRWSGEALDAVRATAVRSLVVRGCAVAMPSDRQDEGPVAVQQEVRVAPAGPLAVALTARARARAICLLEITTPLGATSSALYVAGDELPILQETLVDADVRRYALRSAEGIGAALLSELGLVEGERPEGDPREQLSRAVVLTRSADGGIHDGPDPAPQELVAALAAPVHVTVLASGGQQASVATVVHGDGLGWCLVETSSQAPHPVLALPWGGLGSAALVEMALRGELADLVQARLETSGGA